MPEYSKEGVLFSRALDSIIIPGLLSNDKIDCEFHISNLISIFLFLRGVVHTLPPISPL